MREITVTEIPGCDNWVVEEVEEAGDEDDVAIFGGTNAERRAKAYADWRRSGLD